MYLHIYTETDGWNGKPNHGKVSQRVMLITPTTTTTVVVIVVLMKNCKELFSCCILQTIASPVYECGYYIKAIITILMLTCWCDKIWNFLFMAFCLLASFID
jgi:hypothetical protein